jgi:hypothetical protein
MDGRGGRSIGRTVEDVFLSGNIAVLRRDYEALGKFDERSEPGTPFHSAEDLDLMYPALVGGYRTGYSPDACRLICGTVLHASSASCGVTTRKQQALSSIRWIFSMDRFGG